MFIDFRGRRRDKKRERERERDLREQHQSIASHIRPNPEFNLLLRYVPWPRIEPTTFWCMGQYSKQLSPQPGLVSHFFISFPLVYNDVHHFCMYSLCFHFFVNWLSMLMPFKISLYFYGWDLPIYCLFIGLSGLESAADGIDAEDKATLQWDLESKRGKKASSWRGSQAWGVTSRRGGAGTSKDRWGKLPGSGDQSSPMLMNVATQRWLFDLESQRLSSVHIWSSQLWSIGPHQDKVGIHRCGGLVWLLYSK